MKIDLSFPSNYGVKVLDELATEKRYYYPGAGTAEGRDGIMLEITPSEGNKWIGVFAFGDIRFKGVTGIYSMPDPDKLCIVAEGDGYIVSSLDPGDYTGVKATPVMDVFVIRALHMVIFADHTSIIAYGENGIKWITGRLAYSGFQITSVTDQYLKGEYWEHSIDAMSSFEVDLATGKHTGGIAWQL